MAEEDCSIAEHDMKKFPLQALSSDLYEQTTVTVHYSNNTYV